PGQQPQHVAVQRCCWVGSQPSPDLTLEVDVSAEGQGYRLAVATPVRIQRRALRTGLAGRASVRATAWRRAARARRPAFGTGPDQVLGDQHGRRQHGDREGDDGDLELPPEPLAGNSV